MSQPSDWLAWMPQASLILFVTFFIAVLWYVYSDPRPNQAKKMGEMPLHDGDKEPNHG